MFIFSLDKASSYQKIVLALITFLLFSQQTLFAQNAEELVIPVIKSPYPITEAEWDKYSDTFAYTTNNRTYIRNSVDFELTSTYKNNEESGSTLYYQDPEKILYPKVNCETKDNSVTIYTKENAKSLAQARLVSNLPFSVKSAAVNKSGTLLAVTSFDSNLHVFDLVTMNEIKTLSCNPAVTSLKFTHDNKIVYSDSSRTVKISDLQSGETKNFTCTKNISAVELSYDEESLVISAFDGTIYVYTTTPALQIGYIPSLNNKHIDKLVLSGDNKKLLASGDDGSIYIIRIQETLFATSATAPNVKPYEIRYNALNGNKNSQTEITEYSVTEIEEDAETISPELIQEMVIREDPKQKFEFDEEKKETVVIRRKQPDPPIFPQTTEVEKIDEVLLSQKSGHQEDVAQIQEFKYEGNYPQEVPKATGLVPASSAPSTIKNTTQPQSHLQANQQNVLPTTTTVNTQGTTGTVQVTGTEGTGGNSNITIIINQGDEKSEKSEKDEIKKVAQEEKKAAKETDKAIRDEQKEKRNLEKEKEKEERKKEKEEKQAKSKKEKEEKPNFKERLEEDDIKYYFKDGHGVEVNAGVHKLNEPFLLDIRVPMGYKNYNLIHPFYFGGIIEPYLGIPESEFPYLYKNGEEAFNSPSLTGFRVYVPAGFCVYPLKNSFEVYVELGLGASVNWLWSRHIINYRVFTGPYAGFFGNLKLGVAWDFLNLSFCGSYDAILGLSYGIELGAIVNIGGSRTIGSMRIK